MRIYSLLDPSLTVMASTYTEAGMFELIGQSMSITDATWNWSVSTPGKQAVLSEEQQTGTAGFTRQIRL